MGYGFLKGFSQHLGEKAARNLMALLLSTDEANLSDKELYERTMDLHRDLSEFQARKRRRRARQHWNTDLEEPDPEEIREKQKQQSIVREEMKAEFLKKFAPRLEMVLQEFEEREIEPDDEHMDFESVRFWAQTGEADRVLPILRELAQKLDVKEQ